MRVTHICRKDAHESVDPHPTRWSGWKCYDRSCLLVLTAQENNCIMTKQEYQCRFFKIACCFENTICFILLFTGPMHTFRAGHVYETLHFWIWIFETWRILMLCFENSSVWCHRALVRSGHRKWTRGHIWFVDEILTKCCCIRND